ncbi:MAG: 23S rRNA (uracil(1939)-C(5))-methyltransferase RlmD [Nanoarchaeota archaeon]|nr:23S rRNA (uracil(1939)-C(5))-methyltransferase RlmD [Nanoarchaeota archaeon]
MEPLCNYYGKCGGCSLQHIDYEVQLSNKKKRLAKLLGFSEESLLVFNSNPYNYRNRMDFVFCKQGLGLRMKGDWKKIVSLEKCVISNEKLNSLMNEIAAFFKDVDYFDIVKHTGTFYFAVLRAPRKDSAINFVLNEESSSLGEAVERIKEFSKVTSANNVLITFISPESNDSTQGESVVVKGSEMIAEEYLIDDAIGNKFNYSARGFFQNNTAVAEMMHKYCNEILRKYSTKEAHLLDLYGGVGTFGIMNADLFSQVSIVESIPQCIDAANLNIKENNVGNAKAILLDAKHLKKLQLPQKPQQLFVITDPPRSGMDERTIEQLKKLKPEIIVYISCNPEQLAKDILKFKEYDLKSAALFDMFPQTNHMEAVVELVLKES